MASRPLFFRGLVIAAAAIAGPAIAGAATPQVITARGNSSSQLPGGSPLAQQSDTVRGGIQGTVFDSTGKPLAGAFVGAFQSDTLFRSRGGVTTSDSGHYLIRDLPPAATPSR